MKKSILAHCGSKILMVSSALIFSISSFADVWDSAEYKVHHDQMFKYELGQTVSDYDKEINYLGENWYLLPNNSESISYYVLKNPKNNEISRIRIVYPFDEIKTGREIKYFEDLYGEPIDTNNFLTYEKGDLKVDISSDFDVLGKHYDKMYTIIEFINPKLTQERKDELEKIYRSEKMIRHK